MNFKCARFSNLLIRQCQELYISNSRLQEQYCSQKCFARTFSAVAPICVCVKIRFAKHLVKSKVSKVQASNIYKVGNGRIKAALCRFNLLSTPCLLIYICSGAVFKDTINYYFFPPKLSLGVN